MSTYLLHTERIPVALDDPDVARRHRWRCERVDPDAPYPTHAERLVRTYYVDDEAGGPLGLMVSDVLMTAHLPASARRKDRRRD